MFKGKGALKELEVCVTTGSSELNISGKGLKEVPPEIPKIDKLERLNLANNKLSVLPNAISSLSKLESLNVFNNELTELPTTLNVLPVLRVLTASVNTIKELPRGFGSCPMLAYIDLSHNDIETLPGNFFFMSSLKVLHLSDNKIATIPADIAKLQNLETLVLRDNRITSVGVPPQISDCKSLRELNLQGNEIEYLPQSMGNMNLVGNRHYLKLGGNPVIPELVERLNKSVKEALDYIKTDSYKFAVEAFIRDPKGKKK